MEWKDLPASIKASFLLGNTAGITFFLMLLWKLITGQCYVCPGGIFEVLLPLPIALLFPVGIVITTTLILLVSVIAFLLILLAKAVLGLPLTDEVRIIRLLLRLRPRLPNRLQSKS